MWSKTRTTGGGSCGFLLDYEAGLSPLPIHLVGTLEQGLKQMTYEAELQAAQQGQDVNALRGTVRS